MHLLLTRIAVQDVMTEVYDRVRQAGLDQQQLRELVRQCQQVC